MTTGQETIIPLNQLIIETKITIKLKYHGTMGYAIHAVPLQSSPCQKVYL